MRLLSALAEREGFGEVLWLDDVRGIEIGDGLGNFDNLKEGSSGEVEFFGGGFEDFFSGRAEFK